MLSGISFNAVVDHVLCKSEQLVVISDCDFELPACNPS